MKIIRHQFTEQYIKEEDTVMHITCCGEWIDSQDAVAVDLFDGDEVEHCTKCAKIKSNIDGK